MENKESALSFFLTSIMPIAEEEQGPHTILNMKYNSNQQALRNQGSSVKPEQVNKSQSLIRTNYTSLAMPYNSIVRKTPG
jgi:hypothetical protein